jgi:hypothetical protein
MTQSSHINRAYIAKLGLDNLFGRNYYYNNHLERDIMKVNVFRSGYLDEVYANPLYQNQTIQAIFGDFARLGTEEVIAESAFMRGGIEAYTTDDYVDNHVLEVSAGRSPHILSALTLKKDFLWESLFKKVFTHSVRKNRYPYPASRAILESYAKQDPASFADYVKTSIFKASGFFSFTWRGHLYREYIKTGSLTVKEARKIRSEASAEASERGVKALIDNKDLYPNYQDLMLVISDSKHRDVLVLLANHLPINMLTSIMGTSDQYVLSIVQRRMEEHEALRAKEAAEATSVKVELFDDLF